MYSQYISVSTMPDGQRFTGYEKDYKPTPKPQAIVKTNKITNIKPTSLKPKKRLL